MMTLPKQYYWLILEPGPRLLTMALELYGTAEKPGPGNNPSILEWAKAAGLGKVYREDSTAWCGLFMAYAALQAGFDPPKINPLGARNWLEFGVPQDVAMLGDVLVFWRERKTGFKGHVGIYVGEDDTRYYVLGGNQQDMVSIAPVAKNRLLGIRRCKWRIAQPANVRRVFLAKNGTLSTNEA
jgi:uncharacterized protein (TIGR02594 family)